MMDSEFCQQLAEGLRDAREVSPGIVQIDRALIAQLVPQLLAIAERLRASKCSPR